MLPHLRKTDLLKYLLQGHDGTTIGVLLGLAASKIGTMDAGVSKTLLLHIPTLMTTSPDLDVSALVQVPCLLRTLSCSLVALVHRPQRRVVDTRVAHACVTAVRCSRWR
jgi:hypothetical protein